MAWSPHYLRDGQRPRVLFLAQSRGWSPSPAGGRITLAISLAHLPLMVSPGSLGDGPWESSHVPCNQHPPRETSSLALPPWECLSRDLRRAPSTQSILTHPGNPLPSP